MTAQPTTAPGALVPDQAGPPAVAHRGTRGAARAGPPATGPRSRSPCSSACSSRCRSSSSSSTRSSRRRSTAPAARCPCPTSLYTDGIVAFWERVDFPRKLWNSFVISGLVAVLAVTLSVLNAFALGIGRVKGRTWIVLLILLANMLPQEVLLYPLYFMFKEVGLYNTIWSVIIVFTVIQSAFGTYLLASVYGTFPKEMLEAAALDGASRRRSSGGSSCRSRGRRCRCCSSSSSSGRGTSSSSR